MGTQNVLVVGAGAAGVTAAFFLKYLDKENKFCVKLIDSLSLDSYDKYHRICGEGISETAFQELYPLRPFGVIEKTEFIDEYYPKEIKIRNKLSGYVLNRALFYSKIKDKFEDLGGVFAIDKTVNFEKKGKKIGVMFYKSKVEKYDYVVVADGVNSMIRKSLGINPPLTKLFLQYIVEKEVNHSVLNFYYDSIYEGDYKYVFPNGETTKIGFPYIKGKSFPVEGKILTKQARTIGFGGISKLVFDNFLIVGDAAGLTNPITKGGIRCGMVSGKIAAEAIIQQRSGFYEEKWNASAYGNPVILAAYNFLKNLTNEELASVILRIVDNVELTDKEKNISTAFKLCENYGW